MRTGDPSKSNNLKVLSLVHRVAQCNGKIRFFFFLMVRMEKFLYRNAGTS